MPEGAAVPQAELPLATPSAPAPAAQPAAKAPPRRFELPPEPKPAAAPAAEIPAASEAAPEKPAQTPTDEAPEAPPEGDKPETPDQAAKRESRRFERRIDKATRQRAEAQAEAAFLRQQLSEVKNQQQQAARKPGEPTLEQFDYDPEKYAVAKAEFAKKEASNEHAQRQRQESAHAETQRLQADWETKVERADGKYDDFDTVVGELKPTTPFVAAIMEAENGEDIAYHLGKNPKEAERIAKLPPRSQIREIGKLEAKLLAKPAEPKTPSKAPAPIAPLTAAAPVTTNVPAEADSMNEWMRKRNKQVHGKRS